MTMVSITLTVLIHRGYLVVIGGTIYSASTYMPNLTVLALMDLNDESYVKLKKNKLSFNHSVINSHKMLSKIHITIQSLMKRFISCK